MMLVGFIDFTYGASIGAVSSIVRKVCLSSKIQTRFDVSAKANKRVDLLERVNKRHDLTVFVRTDC